VGALAGCSAVSAGDLLTYRFTEPLNGATSALVDIRADDGNLTIGAQAGDEDLLAGGEIEYLEERGVPVRTVASDGGRATLTLTGPTALGRKGLPWEVCNGGTRWDVVINPRAVTDLVVHSNGGNLTLALAGTAVAGVRADTGGGNIDLTLPENTAGASASAITGGGNVTVVLGRGATRTARVEATSGAGNVVVRLPDGLAARVHAHTGLGKLTVDPRFVAVGDDTYQSPDYDGAADRVEITAESGAGNVEITVN
jgi:hypothetical protein